MESNWEGVVDPIPTLPLLNTVSLSTLLLSAKTNILVASVLLPVKENLAEGEVVEIPMFPLSRIVSLSTFDESANTKPLPVVAPRLVMATLAEGEVVPTPRLPEEVVSQVPPVVVILVLLA
ncbi:MAG: hypothetical protein AABZ49_03580, partial [Thermoproteota archaeon]